MSPSVWEVDLTKSHVRSALATIPAAVLVSFLVLARSMHPPLPRRVRRVVNKLKETFQPFIGLEEAEALRNNPAEQKVVSVDDDRTLDQSSKSPLQWKSAILVSLGMLETLVWLAITTSILVANPEPWPDSLFPLLASVTWIYTVFNMVLVARSAVPLEIFAVYCLLLSGSILQIGCVIYDKGVGLPPPPTWTTIGHGAHLLVILTVLGVVLSIPLKVPPGSVRPTDIVSILLFHVLDVGSSSIL